MAVLVTGASGLVGSHVVEGLAVRGEPVRALVRPASRAAVLRLRAGGGGGGGAGAAGGGGGVGGGDGPGGVAGCGARRPRHRARRRDRAAPGSVGSVRRGQRRRDPTRGGRLPNGGRAADPHLFRDGVLLLGGLSRDPRAAG